MNIPRTVGRHNPHFKNREREHRTFLTPSQPAIIRLDGRAFHSYCSGMNRPYDETFMADMDATMIAVAQQIDGVRLGYVQSDEISVLLTDHISRPTGERVNQGFMFGGAVQKLVSIAASIASSTLNSRRLNHVTDRVALFDARAFSVSDMNEARDYFSWRQQDARVNALSMLASAHFTHRTLLGVPNRERVAMLRSEGIEPDMMPAAFRNGRVLTIQDLPGSSTFIDRRTSTERTVEFVRASAKATPAPDFTNPTALVELARR